MAFFDALNQTTRYGGKEHSGLRRLNLRHRFLVEPFVDDLAGARVLDIAAHDGRWSYALAGAGASEVIGVEARQELIDQYAEYPETDFKSKVTLVQDDLFDALERMVRNGERFDVVALFGILYHVMDHYRILKLVRMLEPRLVVCDSEFVTVPRAVIDVNLEATDNFLNSTAQVEGQAKAATGVPSRRAMERMGDSLGWETSWADWSSVPEDERRGLNEYFRGDGARKVRDTCWYRPAR